MTIINNFEVQRFDSCLRAALYENFISHYADKDDAEIITSDRDFIKRSNVKSRNYTKSPTSLKFPVPIYCRYVGSKANLKNRIVTQKINDKNKRLCKKNDIDRVCDLIQPQWVKVNREYGRYSDLKVFIT